MMLDALTEVPDRGPRQLEATPLGTGHALVESALKPLHQPDGLGHDRHQGRLRLCVHAHRVCPAMCEP